MMVKIGITLGDPAGIGPEILAKTLTYEPFHDSFIPIVIGDARVVQQGLDLIGSPLAFETIGGTSFSTKPGTVYVYDLQNIAPTEFHYGKIDARAGRAAGQFIEASIRLALAKQIDAVVTNPIHKEAFILGGYGKYPGHTEMFADLTGAKRVCMMLACNGMRVCHVTTHVSLLSAITKHITQERIVEVITLAHQTCQQLGIAKPRIGVAGINPHAGDDAIFGDEEARIVRPAIEAAKRLGINADGPVSADTLFPKLRGGMYDIAVAMYHDQGHIALKFHGFQYNHTDGTWEMHGVNVSLGLPIIRTSVDHGTAFDKAGKGIANHKSLVEAIDYARQLAEGSIAHPT